MARKGKFVYNPETLKYEKVRRTLQKRFFNIIGYLLTSFLIAVLLTIFGYNFYDLPKERILKEKIAELDDKFYELDQRADVIDKVLQSFAERDNNIYRTIFESEPLDRMLHINNPYSEMNDMGYYSIFENVENKIGDIEKKIYTQSLSYDTLYYLAQTREEYLVSTPSIPPINLRKLRSRMSGFGMRLHPIYKTRRMHEGLDMSSKHGTPVYAPGDGTVILVGLRGGYGKTIMVDHGFGYKTLYAHLSAYRVRKWQRVKRGQILGLIGNTGISTAPHLHYEVIKNGRAVNPINYFYADLTTDEYENLLKQLEEVNQSFD